MIATYTEYLRSFSYKAGNAKQNSSYKIYGEAINAS